MTAGHRHLDDAPPYKPFPLPGDRPRYAPDRVADIRHVRLELSDFSFESRSFAGLCTTTISPINDGLDAVMFDAVELDIEEVTGDGGRPLAHTYDGKRLRVRFPEPLREGVETRVSVRYRATPRRGLYFNVPDEAYPHRPRQIWSQGRTRTRATGSPATTPPTRSRPRR